ASTATMAHESSVWRLGLSGVGWRGAVLTSVPKKIVLLSASYEGVDQTLLVAGPYSNRCLPHELSTTTAGSSFWGLGPTSSFQTIRPVSGSRASRKPRPVLPAYALVPANNCSSVPPPKITLPSAGIGEAMSRLFQ